VPVSGGGPVDNALQVDVDDRVPVGDRDVLDVALYRDASIVEDVVNLAARKVTSNGARVRAELCEAPCKTYGEFYYGSKYPYS
jgi:hypothetical protein